jgi:hypothetical protein
MYNNIRIFKYSYIRRIKINIISFSIHNQKAGVNGRNNNKSAYWIVGIRGVIAKT